MPRYSLLLLAATPITAWPQIFDKPTTATSVTTTSVNKTYPLLNSTSSSNVLVSQDSTVSPRQLPYEIIKTPRDLIPSAKFRNRGLPIVDTSGTLTVTLPVLKGKDTDASAKWALPVTRGLPVISSDLNITLPVVTLEGLSKYKGTIRGLPVIGDDPSALYKIALPGSVSTRRGLPVVDSDLDSLYKITLPVAKNSKRSEDSEVSFPVVFQKVDERDLPVVDDDEVSLSVTLPVSLDARGLPVVTDDPNALYKITLPIIKTSSSLSTLAKRTVNLSAALHLSVPIVSPRGIPLDTTTGDSAFTLTLPVSIYKGATANTNAKRQHTADGTHPVTIRPPTEAENVPMKHYVRADAVTLRPPIANENVPMHHYSMEHHRSEFSKSEKRDAPKGVLKMPVIKQKKRGLTSRSGREVEKALDQLAVAPL